MRPFNVYVETNADDAEAKIAEAIDAALPADEDHGQAEGLARELAGVCHDLIAAGALGTDVGLYSVNVGAGSASGGDGPDTVLDAVQLNVRALSRGQAPSASEPAQQV